MDAHIDYYFSVASPWTYLGDQWFQIRAKHYGVNVIFHPLSTPDLLPATGGLPLKDCAQPRKDYRLVELKRWKKLLGVRLNEHPKHFPVPEALASKLILAVQDAGENAGDLMHRILKGVWADEQDISDAHVLTAYADLCGLDGKAFVEAAHYEKFDNVFIETTQNAIDAGVFGYPTYIFNGEMYWGQDRIQFLDRALQSAQVDDVEK